MLLGFSLKQIYYFFSKINNYFLLFFVKLYIVT